MGYFESLREQAGARERSEQCISFSQVEVTVVVVGWGESAALEQLLESVKLWALAAEWL
jgi:hypothetical protein